MTAKNSQIVNISLATALPSYRPGETVTALLQAATLFPEDVELIEVEVAFVGIERIDTSWVSSSYRKEVPAINDDKRRIQRCILSSKLQAATQGTFTDANLRRFLVRFDLPLWLPPTFKGTAVRYSYYLETRIEYFHYEAGVMQEAAVTGLTPPRHGQTGSVTTRLGLHIWPRPQMSGDASSELFSGANNKSAISSSIHRRKKSSQNIPTTSSDTNIGNNSTSGNNSNVMITGGEDVPIRCWEIGPGTEVEDAISHITILAKQQNVPISPFSPGRIGSSRLDMSITQSSSGNMASTSGSDATLMATATAPTMVSSHRRHIEEISHHDENEDYDNSNNNQRKQEESDTAFRPSSINKNNIDNGGGDPELHDRSYNPSSLSRLSLGSEAGSDLSSSKLRESSLNTGSVGAGGLRTFALRMGDTPLARVTIHPSLMGPLQPGSILSSTVEFPDVVIVDDDSSSISCMQINAMLEVEEVVDGAWKSGKPQSGGSGNVLRRVLEEQVEVTGDALCTNFVFSLPPDATPTFQTPLVSLRWILRFTFTALRSENIKNKGNRGQRAVDQLSWALPLLVLPPPCAAM